MLMNLLFNRINVDVADGIVTALDKSTGDMIG
jgi:hypothetical protein